MKKLLGICLMIVLQVFTSAVADDMHFICVVHKGEWVWLRSMPDKDADTVYGKDDFKSQIRYGTEGEIHEIANLYARITTTDGREGWADVSYLLIPCKEEVWTVNTTTKLNKRETPLGRWLGEINPGVRISVLGWRYDKNGELWAHVYHGGYVKACFLSKAD